MRIVVTGGAGFIGSNLVDRLLDAGHDVLGVDNLSTGSREFLAEASTNPRFELVELDLLRDERAFTDVVAGADAVYHLAANADVRFGWEHPRRDLEQNIVVTQQVLEALRVTGVRRLLFSSTGSVYGEAPLIPTPEDCPLPLQTSLYGASKMAAEGLIQAYCEGVGLRATILRFVSILGARYTHGHVVDFVQQLRNDPGRLVVLGDGLQKKSYLEVSDCMAAMLALLPADDAVGVYNLGVDDYCTVKESAGWICERLGVDPLIEFTGGDRGWVGDNPFIFLETKRIRDRGWKPVHTIREAVERTVDYVVEHDWILDRARREVGA